MQLRILFLLAFACIVPLASHDVITTKLTYTRDVSRIFAKRCVACHGENSAIALTSYEGVRPWAVSIKEQVLSRSMPPWGAVKGFGHFNPDGGLSQEEIMIIAWWVTGGAPQGDRALLPVPAPVQVSAKKPVGASLSLNSGTVLQRSLHLQGIRPLVEGTVDSARITANFPGGRREPLLWLYHYDGRNDRTFQFRTPVMLPSGTLVESTTPLRLELQITPP